MWKMLSARNVLLVIGFWRADDVEEDEILRAIPHTCCNVGAVRFQGQAAGEVGKRIG
jgi:hypothetical protein